MTLQQNPLRCPGFDRVSAFPTPDAAQGSRAAKVALVIVPGFSTLDVGAILESFEQANRIANRDAMAVTSYAFGDKIVQSRSGLRITCDQSTEALLGHGLNNRADILILCCGEKIPHDIRPDMRKLLHGHYSRGTKIVGIGNAAWLLAEWGFLNERSSTVHWQYLRAFTERYLDVNVTNSLFVDTENVSCCAGEAATLDLMFDILSTHLSESIANEVLNRLLVAYPRSASMPQPGSQEQRLRHQPALLQSAVRLMAANIENPLKISRVASDVGTSSRQLERLFKRHLNCTPKSAYLHLRLEHALQLIEQTEMPLAEVSLACGMSTPSMLSRHFKRVFGISPSALRDQRLAVTVTGSTGYNQPCRRSAKT